MEDNESDVFLVQEALEETKLPLVCYVVKNGEEAVRFLDDLTENSSKACPGLVILDINLPKKGGGEVLKHMRRNSRCARALVIAISTSDSVHDRSQMMNLGANAYFHKPSDYDEFMKLGEIVKSLFAATPPVER